MKSFTQLSIEKYTESNLSSGLKYVEDTANSNLTIVNRNVRYIYVTLV